MGCLLDRLEQDRLAAGIQQGQQAEDTALVKRHALTVFKRADDADRAMLSSAQTAREFLAAADLLAVVIALGDADAVLMSMIKHSKSRAIEIAKAKREGRQPAPPPGSDESCEHIESGVI